MLTNRQLAPVETLQQDQITPTTVGNYQDLLFTLTGKDYPREVVDDNLWRATDSDTTTILVRRDTENGMIAAGLAINECDLLDGIVTWIDDVVTLESYQRMGASSSLMDEAEKRAATSGGAVVLTSNPTREDARRGYEKRQYSLEGSVWRKQLAGISDEQIERANEALLTTDDVSTALVDEIAQVLPGREKLRERLYSLAASPSKGLIIAREEGQVAALALAHMCPIPVGHKPWVSVPYSRDPDASAQALGLAEAWVSVEHPSVNFFVADGIAEPPVGAQGYEQRTTGLFVKRFV